MSENESARATAVAELKAINRVLFDDVIQAESLYGAAPSDFAIRTNVRTYFAYVEGMANLLRRVTLASLDGLGVLTVKETDALRDQRRKTMDTGEVRLFPSFMPMGEGLNFTLRCYAKNHGIEDYKPVLGKGWESMLASIQIRNRVTHPKSVADLKLTAAEIACINDARTWWYEAVRDLLTLCEQEDERILQSQG
jgi:hypothetical protein